MQSEFTRRATLVDWHASPALLTVDQSAFLLGVDAATIREGQSAFQLATEGSGRALDSLCYTEL